MNDTAATLTRRRDGAVAVRLRRIEGQACGLIRMHEEGRSAEELLDQIAALRGALLGLGLLLAGHEIADRPANMQPDGDASGWTASDVASLLHRLVRP